MIKVRQSLGAYWGSRWFALLLLLVSLSVLYALAVLPYWQIFMESKETVAELKGKVAKFQQVVLQKPAYENRLRMLQNNHKLKRYYLNAKTTALATAQLQQLVKQVIVQNGAKLSSTQAVLASETGAEQHLQTVSLNVAMKGSLHAVRDVLYKLESSQQLLLLDQLIIKMSHVGRRLNSRRNGENAASMPEQVPLDVRFRISGFMQANPRQILAKQGAYEK